MRELYEDVVAIEDFQPTFRKHPATLLGGVANVGWAYDDDVDLTTTCAVRRCRARAASATCSS